MWEDTFDVYEDVLGDGQLMRRVAADMSIEHALLFMKAFMEEYYHDTQFNLVLKHAKQDEYPREENVAI